MRDKHTFRSHRDRVDDENEDDDDDERKISRQNERFHEHVSNFHLNASVAGD